MQIQAADYPLQVEPAQVLGFDCGLGAGLRICIFFGNKTQNPLKSVDFRGFFLFIVYCGAEFEECRYGKKCDNSMFSCNLFRYVL